LVHESVEGASDAEADLVGGVKVDHGGADVGVAHELLDGSDVAAVAEHLGGEGVSEGVAGRLLEDLSGADGILDLPLDGGGVEVVAGPSSW
jgi:hypothetical protein